MYITNLGLLRKILTEISEDNSIKSLLLFCADNEKPAPDELSDVLKCNNKPLVGGIFPEIIIRVLYLGNVFSKELAFLKNNKPVNGILSIGEITNPGNTSLKLFNKTIAVAQWKKTN